MNREFTTALEAEKIIFELHHQIKLLPYNKDLRKLLENCEKLKGILGSAEVRARQLQKPYLANKARNDLKTSIDYLEKVLLIATLSA